MDRIQDAIARARQARERRAAAGGRDGTEGALDTRVLQFQPARVADGAGARPSDGDDPGARGEAHYGPADVWTGLPLEPAPPSVLARALVVADAPRPESAGFDLLRTRVMEQMREGGRRRLALTSPTAGCGKSTVILNLAYCLARQSNLRVALVDLDLRNPSLARMLELDGARQVLRVLDGSATVSHEARRLTPRLAALVGTRMAADPAEMLLGEGLPALLDGIDGQLAADIVLVDLPPMAVADDAIAVLAKMDAALMVAAAERSTVRQVDACEREIAARTQMLGVVLNRCDLPADDYGSDYAYAYAAGGAGR
jgi:Mrp family chromosome partitioning ATPase